MTTKSAERTSETEPCLANGACEHLADMILELQQMALRLGATTVSTQLQAAYLETRLLQSQQRRAGS